MGAAPHHRSRHLLLPAGAHPRHLARSASAPRPTTPSSAPTRRPSWASARSPSSPRSVCTRSTACASSCIDFLAIGRRGPARHVLGRHRALGAAADRLPPPPPHARVRRRVTMTHPTIDAPRSPHVAPRRRAGQLGEVGLALHARLGRRARRADLRPPASSTSSLGERRAARIDFAFVAGKLADPFWIVWDMLLLWLALIHGANGMRTLINDYAHGRLRAPCSSRPAASRPSSCSCSARSCSRPSTPASPRPRRRRCSRDFCSTQ